jgi:hypothetical protein
LLRRRWMIELIEFPMTIVDMPSRGQNAAPSMRAHRLQEGRSLPGPTPCTPHCICLS